MAAQNFTVIVSVVNEAFVKTTVEHETKYSGVKPDDLNGTYARKESLLKGIMTYSSTVDTACKDMSVLSKPTHALLLWGSIIKMWFHCIKETGRNLATGKDEFFKVPTRWNFAKAPNGDVLANTVESMIEAGLVQYVTGT